MGTGQQYPRIVRLIRIRVPIADEASSGTVLRSYLRVQTGHRVPAGDLKVRIERQGIDFRASSLAVPGVVSGLVVPKRFVWFVQPGVHTLGVEKAQIIVVGRDRTEVVIPNDLLSDVGIVGVEQGKRLTGHE